MSDAPALEVFPAPPKIINFPAQESRNLPVPADWDVPALAYGVSDFYSELLNDWQLEDCLQEVQVYLGDRDVDPREPVRIEMSHQRDNGTSKRDTYCFRLNADTGEYAFCPPLYLIDNICERLWRNQRLNLAGEYGFRVICQVLVEIGYLPSDILRKMHSLAEARPDLGLPVESLYMMEA